MQIKIRYDDSFQTVEVTEQECANMICADYQERLTAAEDPSTVQPRTMQEIMDERFNKPEYNCYHKHHRNTCCLDAFEEESTLLKDDESLDMFIECKELHHALKSAVKELQPQQQELVQRVFFNNERPSDIAKELGISKQAMNDRLNKIYAVLRKKMKKF